MRALLKIASNEFEMRRVLLQKPRRFQRRICGPSTCDLHVHCEELCTTCTGLQSASTQTTFLENCWFPVVSRSFLTLLLPPCVHSLCRVVRQKPCQNQAFFRTSAATKRQQQELCEGAQVQHQGGQCLAPRPAQKWLGSGFTF